MVVNQDAVMGYGCRNTYKDEQSARTWISSQGAGQEGPVTSHRFLRQLLAGKRFLLVDTTLYCGSVLNS